MQTKLPITKAIVFSCFISILPNASKAQSLWEPFLPPAPAPQLPNSFPEGVTYSSIAFADVDNDGDEDVMICGVNSNNTQISKLYFNNGTGVFTEALGTPFDVISDGSIAFSDIDGDGDSDVLLTGINASNASIAKLYSNNGAGVFTEVSSTPFDGVGYSSIAFSDVDNDGDQDVLITGENSLSERIAKLYTNAGGVFTEVVGTPFEGVYGSSVAFADVDNDGDNDVLIIGENSSAAPTARLYSNSGGVFTEVVGTPFDAASFGSVAFFDINNDGDKDLLITGYDALGSPLVSMYANTGGSFSLITGTPFEAVAGGAIAFSDANNDGYMDVLISGSNASYISVSNLYYNTSGSGFALYAGTPIEGVNAGGVGFTDIDNDGFDELLITGSAQAGGRRAKLYKNTTGFFTAITGTSFDGSFQGGAAVADFDLNGTNDVLTVGINELSQRTAVLYSNDGSGGFSQVPSTPFDGVWRGAVAISDIENDLDKDVLIVGVNSLSEFIAKLYTNSGTGTFTLVPGTPFDGVWQGTVSFADVDNDGDEDVLITGQNALNESIAKLYTNNGAGVFTEVSGTPFEGVRYSAVAFSDIDNDGDKDVLITGTNGLNARSTKLYTNAGGIFTLVTGTPFDDVTYGSVAFADVNNDGSNDVLITGQNSLSEIVSKLYTNNGSGTFTEQLGTPFDGVYSGAIAFSDVNNDGDQDVLISGVDFDNDRISKLYRNNGSGIFTLVQGTPFLGMYYGAVAFADFNADGDVDLFLSGSNEYGTISANAYRNVNLPCSNTTGTDVITACISYQWIDGNTYTSSNNTATFMDATLGGCDSLITLNLTISTVDISVANANATLSANAAGATYQWIDCDNGNTAIVGEIGQTFAPTANGNYAVIVGQNGCSDTSACTTVNSVGLVAQDALNNISIYPNPSNGNFTLTQTAGLGTTRYSIKNVAGNVIHTFESEAHEVNIDLKDQAAGIYLLRIDQQERSKVFKLMKE